MAVDPSQVDLKDLQTHYIQHNIRNIQTKPRDWHAHHSISMAAPVERCPGFTEVCVYCEYYEKLPPVLEPVYKKIICVYDGCRERREKDEAERQKFLASLEEDDPEFGLFD